MRVELDGKNVVIRLKDNRCIVVMDDGDVIAGECDAHVGYIVSVEKLYELIVQHGEYDGLC